MVELVSSRRFDGRSQVLGTYLYFTSLRYEAKVLTFFTRSGGAEGAQTCNGLVMVTLVYPAIADWGLGMEWEWRRDWMDGCSALPSSCFLSCTY